MPEVQWTKNYTPMAIGIVRCASRSGGASHSAGVGRHGRTSRSQVIDGDDESWSPVAREAEPVRAIRD